MAPSTTSQPCAGGLPLESVHPLSVLPSNSGRNSASDLAAGAPARTAATEDARINTPEVATAINVVRIISGAPRSRPADRWLVEGGRLPLRRPGLSGPVIVVDG